MAIFFQNYDVTVNGLERNHRLVRRASISAIRNDITSVSLFKLFVFIFRQNVLPISLSPNGHSPGASWRATPATKSVHCACTGTGTILGS